MKKIILMVIVLISVSFMCTAQSGYKTKHLILVTMDGLRWEEVFHGADSSFINNKKLVEHTKEFTEKYWDNDLTARRKKLMPFFWTTIAENGQLYGNREKNCFVNVKNPYWFSYPGYNEILTGFADERINSNSFGPNPNVSLFEEMNKTPEYKDKIAAFTSWDAFNDILNEKRSGLLVNAAFEHLDGFDNNSVMTLLNNIQFQLPDVFTGVRLDGVTFNMGLEYLKVKRPKVLYLAFDETDDFAHAGRYEDYLNSAHYEDNFIETLWNWVQSDPEYKNSTTILVTCDHGRGVDSEKWRDHGTETPNSNQTWFAVIGPDTPALGEISAGQFYNNQFAETMATLLGFDYKTENPVGKKIDQVLKGN